MKLSYFILALFGLELSAISSALAQRSVTVTKPGTIFAIVTNPAAITVIDKDGNPRPISVSLNESESQLNFISVKSGETLQVKQDENCDLYLPQIGTARITSDSKLKIPPKDANPEQAKSGHSLELLKGKLFLNIDSAKLQKKSKQFRLKTPTAILAVKGTQFFAETKENYDSIGVNKGIVVVSEPVSGTFKEIKSGQAIAVKEGQLSAVRRLNPEEQGYTNYYQGAVEENPRGRLAPKLQSHHEI